MPEEVASPCVGICVIDPGSGLCTGCLRKLDEIAGWGAMGNDQKHIILHRVDERRREVRRGAYPELARTRSR